MSDIINIDKIIILSVFKDTDHQNICKISRALSVIDRVKIMKSLLSRSKNVIELSNELNIPASSVSRHIEILSEAQLIRISYQPGLKGHVKYCSQVALGYNVCLDIPKSEESFTKEYIIEMPVGLYSDCDIEAPCGIIGKKEKIGPFDCPYVFYIPERINAECIWFATGFVTYHFPVPINIGIFSSITFSFEICSEAIYYNEFWPSDITIFINNLEVLTFTSSGDFGGRRGKFTPNYWPLTATQFGLLKSITINSKGVFLDNTFIHNHLCFTSLKIENKKNLSFKIGIKKDAIHCGGLNLFGKNFGDYNQSIVMKIK